jgi:hypothetical protein
MKLVAYLSALLLNAVFGGAQNGNTTYTNPILNAVGADPYVVPMNAMNETNLTFVL